MLAKLQKKLAEIRANEERGMSLTELVVVVAILAILVAIAVPVYLSIQEDARAQSVKTTLANALTVYQYETGREDIETARESVLNLDTSEMSVVLTPASPVTAPVESICAQLGDTAWSVSATTGEYTVVTAGCSPVTP